MRFWSASAYRRDLICGIQVGFIGFALFVRLSGPERQSIRMRKLAEVRMVRKVIWQDE